MEISFSLSSTYIEHIEFCSVFDKKHIWHKNSFTIKITISFCGIDSKTELTN